jgi:hypothetical protein
MSWYTWVFDGVGSTALIGGGAALYRKFIAKRLDTPLGTATTNPTKRESTEPTPIQIDKEIQAVLPFDREHSCEKYKGLSVTWQVKFASIRSDEFTVIEKGVLVTIQRWRFHCRFGDGYPYVAVCFNLKEVPPELKVLKEGSILWLQGRICWVSDHGIVQLKDDPMILEVMLR